MTDDAVLAELGRRLERHRVERNRTQAEMAAEAGIGRATIKLLRTLGLLSALDAAVPESIDLPIAQLEREQRRTRRRARGSRGGSRAESAQPAESAQSAESAEERWTWGEDAGRSA
jgi:hypothetical protein